MAKTKKKSVPKASSAQNSLDGVYLLKLVLYVIFGSMWLKISNDGGLNVPLPVGFLIGFLFASHEHFRIDRKIEYAVLVIAMFIGYLAPYGLYITI